MSGGERRWLLKYFTVLRKGPGKERSRFIRLGKSFYFTFYRGGGEKGDYFSRDVPMSYIGTNGSIPEK